MKSVYKLCCAYCNKHLANQTIDLRLGGRVDRVKCADPSARCQRERERKR